MNRIIALALIAITISSCEKEYGISHNTIKSEVLDVTGNISRVYVSAGAQQSNSGGLFDTFTGATYQNETSAGNFENIDLYYRYSIKYGNELYTTDAVGYTYTRELELIDYAWPYRNRAELRVLRTPTEAQLLAFQNVKNDTELNSLFQNILTSINVPNGEKRLSQITTNSLILFQSSTKNTKSIILVNSVANSTQGRLTLSIKTDISNRNIIPKQSATFKNNGKPADTLILTVSNAKTDENFIDLFNRKVYKETDLPNGELRDINLVHTLNTNSHSFYTPTSSYSGSTYVPSFWDWLNQQPNRSTNHILRLDVNSGTPLVAERYNAPGKSFDNIAHNNESLTAYHSYIAHNGSWGSYFTAPTVGTVFRVIDFTTGNIGFVKIVELDVPNKTAKIAVKYVIAE